jgi:ABC-type phosphate transport system auxiliary subunit
LNGIVESGVEFSTEIVMKLNDEYQRQKQTLMDDISSKNSEYFETEMVKLDKWGDDQRASLKSSMKDLETEIKDLKKKSKIVSNLAEKLQIEKQRKSLEVKLNDAEHDYFDAAKEIEKRKDVLIDNIEKMLEQTMAEEDLFMIRWRLV